MAEAKKSTDVLQVVVTKLADEEYGILIMQVQEIITLPGITRIPGMPDFIEGVINLRGRIIPIIDLRKRFKLEVKERDAETRIIVVEIGAANAKKEAIGLIVDRVSEVITLSGEQIDEIPPAISRIDAEYLSGVGKLEKRIIILLSLDKVLSELEKTLLTQIESDAKV